MYHLELPETLPDHPIFRRAGYSISQIVHFSPSVSSGISLASFAWIINQKGGEWVIYIEDTS